MDSNKESIEVRSQKSEVRSKEGKRQRPAGLLVSLLVLLLFSPSPLVRAQTVSLGGTGALGRFINPTSVTTNTGNQVCGYAVLKIDLAQGKVFAIPNRTTGNSFCTDTSPVDITNVIDGTTGQKPFANAPTGPITDGVLEVTDFTLQPAFGPSTFLDDPIGFGNNKTYLVFLPNANNTPVFIRATGNVSINSGAVLNVAGQNGQNRVTTFLRGAGGAGGPGGYRGGDGGNGGLSPSDGSAGFGPGGRAGGTAGTASCTNATTGAQFLTVGTTVAGRDLTAFSNDLLTMLRGGSGGGGGGGCTGSASGGGGGGGGGIEIAANNTITVSGAVTAQGGNNGCCSGGLGAGGTGGVIRLVAATIAGAGTITADRGASSCTFGPCPGNSDQGIIRLEAFTISFSGTLTGGVAAASAPGQVFLPTTPNAFLRFASVTDTDTANHPGNSVSVLAAGQAIPGRTGVINPPDVTMPNLNGPALTVNVVVEAGTNINTGASTGWPAAKQATLVLTPLNPAQGTALTYGPATINCTLTTVPCTATFSSVSLPLGYSSMSAFAVLNISNTGALSRMFPKMIQGEEIENVRLETTGSDTKYVLIAKSGKEFPYKLGQ